ncbi:hypothetical protein ACN42_g4563 [Penicillium freii]|uniref:Uncharacterized protein n=1 Tax=Penicillium freii TaxID=48697 RepID=A0A101ML91_PENFR|nr:hypothetical protein ACN42_g4563 [Penicillium freii]
MRSQKKKKKKKKSKIKNGDKYDVSQVWPGRSIQLMMSVPENQTQTRLYLMRRNGQVPGQSKVSWKEGHGSTECQTTGTCRVIGT